jgi:hypothetical protein
MAELISSHSSPGNKNVINREKVNLKIGKLGIEGNIEIILDAWNSNLKSTPWHT